MSTPGRAPLRAFARRRAPRCALAVPVRVTVLRSGTAYSIPGRSVDLGEGGIAVVLAGEVRVTDVVGIEFLLPDLGLGLQTKATVRHYSALRCGFEFKDLSRHQQAVIREWARQRLQAKTQNAPATSQATGKAASAGPLSQDGSAGSFKLRFLWLAVGLIVLAVILLWWHWQRGWKDLEEQIPEHAEQMVVAPQYFAADLLPVSRGPVETRRG